MERAGAAIDEEIERGAGGLELPPLVLEPADFGKHFVEKRPIVANVGARHHRLDVRPSRQFAHEDSPLVPDRLRVDVLIRLGRLGDGVDVHPPLVREGTRPHERLPGPVDHVGRLVDKARKLGEVTCACPLEDTEPVELEGEVGNDGDQIGISATFADAVDRPLHLGGAGVDGRERIGDGDIAVVVAMDPDGDVEIGLLESGAGFADKPGHLVGERAAVGVTEDDPGGPGTGGGEDRLGGVAGIEFPAVEEMLGVVKHLTAGPGEESDGVGDHGEVFLARHAEHLGDMEGGSLSDDRDHGGARCDEGLHAGIVGGRHSTAARHSEGDDPRVGKRELPDAGEILGVLGIGERIAPLDEVDPCGIEPARDRELVLEREIDPFPLAAIAECGVVDLDRAHGKDAWGGGLGLSPAAAKADPGPTRHPIIRHHTETRLPSCGNS